MAAAYRRVRGHWLDLDPGSPEVRRWYTEVDRAVNAYRRSLKGGGSPDIAEVLRAVARYGRAA